MSLVVLVGGRGHFPIVVDTTTASPEVGIIEAILEGKAKTVVVFAVAAPVEAGVILGITVAATTTFFFGSVSFFLVVTIATTSARFIERLAKKTNQELGQRCLVEYIYIYMQPKY